MIYVVIPHAHQIWEDCRMFTTFAAAEQMVLRVARGYLRERGNPDWCVLVGYEGTDELVPTFLYTIQNMRLIRETFPTPSP